MTTKVLITVPGNNHKAAEVRVLYGTAGEPQPPRVLDHGETESFFIHGTATLQVQEVERPELHDNGGFFDFGAALHQLRAGNRVARHGWNGKGMWLALTPGSSILAEAIKPGHALSQVAAEHPDLSHYSIGAHIDMRAADGSLVVGWLASQTDMLATDWMVAA